MKVLVYFSILPIIFILFIGGMLTTNSAFGLSCDATDVLWSFEEADAIFLGKALSKEYQSNPRHEDRFDAVTLFSVIEPYKGIYGEKINITSSEWKWGVNFTENSDYVIFANNNDGMFEHALCTPTQLVSESNLSEIRKISQNYILPPFSQIKFGVSPNEIQCKQNLVLIQKYDGTPACVTESTKQKLTERGWTKIKSNTTDETTTNPPFHKNQDATELPSYRDIRSSIQIDQNAPILSDNELDRTLEELRQAGLPIVMSAIDYEKGVIAIWTPDVSNEEPFKEHLGDIPFVLLFEEAPPRWEHGDPKPEPDPEPEKLTNTQEHYDIEIIGLNDQYKTNEEYSFSFVISGYGYACANYEVKYPDENGKYVTRSTEVLCAAEQQMEEFEINHLEKKETLGNVAIQKPGTYTVTVTFEKPNKYFPTTASQKFQVIE